MEELSLGIDVGSSGCKAAVVNKELLTLYTYSVRYENTIVCTGTGEYEQQPEILKEAAFECIRQAVRMLKTDQKISCIGITGQMHGLVALDKDGKPIRPVISCVDFRNKEQNEDLHKKAGGISKMLEYTNNKMISSCTGGKIIWMKEKEPLLYEKTACVINPKDYIRMELTGICGIDESDASGFGLYDVRKHEWSRGLLKLSGISEKILPNVFKSGQTAGQVLPGIAEQLGIEGGIPVIAGGGDAIMQTIGSGAIQEGIYSIVLGTGGLISASLRTCVVNRDAMLQIYCSGLEEQWVAYAGLMSVGAAIDWFRNCYYSKELLDSGENVYQVMEKEAGTVKAGSEGLLFYPMLLGQRNPVEDPLAKGTLIGLTPCHGRRHMYRALLEGLAMGMKNASEQLIQVAGDIKEIRISGGGASSSLWCQIIADVFQRDVCRLDDFKICGAKSCAVMGAVALGAYSSAEEAYRQCRIQRVFHPDKERADTYTSLYKIYKNIYPQVSNIFTELVKFEDG